MLRSSLCEYSDAYILVSGTITITAFSEGGRNNGMQVAFKNCAPFTNCISEINNTLIDNAKDIDVVIPMYNLIEYSDNYSKTSGDLWQYYRDEPALNNAGALANFPGNSSLFKYKQSNFWRTIEMPLINCEIILILTWSGNFIISNAAANQDTTFAITHTHTKHYVPVLTSSTEDNAKLLQQF